MRAALRGGDEVHVALPHHIVIVREPDHRPVDLLVRSFEMTDERLLGHGRHAVELGHEVCLQSVFVVPLLVVLAILFADEAHPQTGREDRLGAHDVLEARDIEFRRIEELFVGPEANRRPGVALAHFAGGLQLRALFSIGEPHEVFLAVAPHPHLQLLRERVHDRYAHAVQPSGEPVVFLGELRAGVQSGEDHLDAGDALLGVLVDGHAAAVVGHRKRAVVMKGDRDLVAVTGDRLVRRVVDDFLRQMIRPLGRGVHARPLAHRLETGQNFDCRGVVGGRHHHIV